MVETGDETVQTYTEMLLVLVVLLSLTGVTVAASRVELGGLNIWMTILIASIKSTFVLLFFMHLKHEGRFIRTTFVVTICTLSVLVGFLFWDVSFR